MKNKILLDRLHETNKIRATTEHTANDNMIQLEKPKKAFTFSFIAGILIVINAVLLGAAATWIPQVIPTLPGSANNANIPFYTLTELGLTCGFILLLNAMMMMRFNPAHKKVWGIVTVIFSVPSVVMGGGFIAGFILGIMSGASTFSKRMQSIKPKLPFSMTDSTGMRFEGAGPKIMAPLFATFIVTVLLSYIFRPIFNYPLEGTSWIMITGTVFLAIGIPFWLISVGMFIQAWMHGLLETRGPFAIMTNPIYSSFIVFVIPGISLLLGWWPILLTSMVMYIAQRMFIREEEEALKKKFGRKYEEYREKVLIKFL